MQSACGSASSQHYLGLRMLRVQEKYFGMLHPNSDIESA